MKSRGHAREGDRSFVPASGILRSVRIIRKPITDPRLRKEVARVARIAFDFLSELPHQHSQVFRLIGTLCAPDGLEDRAMRQDTACMAQEQRQEFEFLRGEANLIVAALHAVTIEVDRQIAARQLSVEWTLSAQRSTERGSDPRH
jgi:tryptophan 2,3-dioxygenase